MIDTNNKPLANNGRGAYDTTGVPKPPPPKPRGKPDNVEYFLLSSEVRNVVIFSNQEN